MVVSTNYNLKAVGDVKATQPKIDPYKVFPN